MGGEISKQTNKNSKMKNGIKSPNKNRNSLQEEENDKTNSMSASNIEVKAKRKKEKIIIVAKNKKSSNQEKKVLELIHKNNKKKEDYQMIYNIIDKHFFMQTLNAQARNEIIITMSLCRVKKNTTLFKQGSNGNYWYIVHEGQLEKIFDEKKNNNFK
jgi:hypothetical protein